MRLKKFRVRAFRCIHDSGLVEVTNAVALIGKNESGKTAILLAVAHLNKDLPINEHDICEDLIDDLPPDTRIIEGHFQMTEGERALLAELLPTIPVFDDVVIYRTSTGNTEYEFPTLKLPTQYSVNEKETQKFNAAIASISQLIPGAVVKAFPENEEAEQRQKTFEIESVLAGLPPIAPQEYKKIKAQIGKLAQLLGPFEKLKEVQSAIEGVRAAFKSLFVAEDTERKLKAFISDKLHPKLIYFSDYRLLEGIINVPEYTAAAAGATKRSLNSYSFQKHETIRNLLYLSGLDVQKLVNEANSPEKLVPRTKRASNKLTEMLALTWKGKKINVSLEYSHPHLMISVADIYENGVAKNNGLLDRRSAGFRWHFSFFVNFRAGIQQSEFKEAILLLDEPGMTLHPEQQAGTLEVIRDVSGTNQVIYTTHSPFMIHNFAAGNLLTIEFDQTTKASSVRDNFWEGDWQTITPILHSIGDQVLLRVFGAFGSHMQFPLLLVEGNTDYKYLFVLAKTSDSLEALKTLIPIPAGGASQVKTLALFHHTRNRPTIVLFDGDAEGREQGQLLEKDGFPKERIVYVSCKGKSDVEIEDLFTDCEILALVNDYYRERLRNHKSFRLLKKDDLRAAREKTGSVKITKLLDSIFTGNGWGSFDKDGVCSWFCRKAIGETVDARPITMDQFEELFKSLYAALQNVKPGGPKPKKSTTEEAADN